MMRVKTGGIKKGRSQKHARVSPRLPKCMHGKEQKNKINRTGFSKCKEAFGFFFGAAKKYRYKKEEDLARHLRCNTESLSPLHSIYSTSRT